MRITSSSLMAGARLAQHSLRHQGVEAGGDRPEPGADMIDPWSLNRFGHPGFASIPLRKTVHGNLDECETCADALPLCYRYRASCTA